MTHRTIKTICAAAAVLAAIAASPANANPTWKIENAHFDDGGILTGYFSFNVYDILTAWHLSATAGSTITVPYVYHPNINASNITTSSVGFYSSHLDYTADYSRSLVLTFTAPITFGGINIIDAAASYECGSFACTDKRYLVVNAGQPADALSIASVPEPASFALLGSGLLAAAGLKRRKTRKTAQA